MRITNLTGQEIICSVDGKNYVIVQKEMLDVNDFEQIRICHKVVSYSTDGTGNSKLLKFLKVTDDPFDFSKEYHIVINLEVTKSQIDNSKQMVISSATKYVDYDVKTYYEYFELQCDGRFVSPKQIFLMEIDTIKLEFTKNVKKLKWWKVVTDGLIEPLVFDAMGLILSCTVLSRFVGNYAWFLFVPVIVVQLISILIMIFKPTAKKQIQKFSSYLNEDRIRKVCYEKEANSLNTDN